MFCLGGEPQLTRGRGAAALMTAVSCDVGREGERDKQV